MKLTVTIARVLTGLLFIFSGLVKAIDPLGLSYKMQEFFEAWANDGIMKGLMESLNNYSLGFSIVMITLEVVVGVALLIGWQKKFTTWILLLLMLFFTFLTSYVLFTGKIRACGCFGDCIPLTPVQTFTKDIILLCLSLLLLIKRKYIIPIAKPLLAFLIVAVATVLTLILQVHVLKHLPVVDCLPYKKGNNILELRKMPANAIQDKYEYSFIYEKNGAKKDFAANALPDSTWKYVDRKQTLIQKGKNNIPLISDFSLTAEDGSDATEIILNNEGTYYLFFMKELPGNTESWLADYKTLLQKSVAENKKMYVITAQKEIINDFLQKNHLRVDGIFTCDATALKTVARVNPTLYLMQGPVVKGKWSGIDIQQAGSK